MSARWVSISHAGGRSAALPMLHVRPSGNSTRTGVWSSSPSLQTRTTSRLVSPQPAPAVTYAAYSLTVGCPLEDRRRCSRSVKRSPPVKRYSWRFGELRRKDTSAHGSLGDQRCNAVGGDGMGYEPPLPEFTAEFGQPGEGAFIFNAFGHSAKAE